jgi:hypothetical protein
MKEISNKPESHEDHSMDNPTVEQALGLPTRGSGHPCPCLILRPYELHSGTYSNPSHQTVLEIVFAID